MEINEPPTYVKVKVSAHDKPSCEVLRLVKSDENNPVEEPSPLTRLEVVEPSKKEEIKQTAPNIENIKKEEVKQMTMETEKFPAQIKVIGVGGGGCNTVRRMMKHPTPGVEYIVCNTDIKSLQTVGGALAIQLGEHLTHGLGAGGNTSIGARSAEEGHYVLKKALKDAELVFITAGMGGGTGTGAAPVVAQIAREGHALVIAVVTTPFSFEGKRRFDLALGGIKRLRDEVDNLVIVHNDRLLQLTEHTEAAVQAFAMADEVVGEGILSISQLVNVPGEINVDLADVKTVMSISGGALMAMGRGVNTRYPAMDAAEQAISNPLLDINVKGAKGVLFNFAGGPELTLGEVNDAANFIAKEVDPGAIIFFGMTAPNEELHGTVKLTLVATGIRPELPESWLSQMGEAIREAIVGHRAR